MDLSVSESFLRKIYYAYIREPFMKIKERWLAYFAEFAIDEGPSTADAESEIYSSMEMIPKKMWQSNGGIREKTEYPLSRFNFIISTLGTTLGLGYLWRTPTRIFHSQSPGAYLYMYCLATIFFGYFLYVTELSLGQYSSSTAIALFRNVPLTQGVGYTLILFTYILSLHYSQVMSSAAYLFTASFTFDLPWSHCPVDGVPDLELTTCGGSSHLNQDEVEIKCSEETVKFNNTRLCLDEKYSSSIKEKCCSNKSKCVFDKDLICFHWLLPSAYYSYINIGRYYTRNHPLHSYFGDPDLKFLLYFGSIWFLAFLFSSINMKWTRIITMIVTPCILVCHILLLPIVLGNDGASYGLSALFIPDLNAFLDPYLWARAVNDSLYSLGLSTVLVFFFGSVSRFRSPCHLDSILIIFSVLFTTLLSCIVMFCEAGRVSVKGQESINSPSYIYSDYDFLYLIMEILLRLPAPWLCTIIYLSLFGMAGVVTLSGLIISMSVTICDATRIYLKDKHIVNFLLTFSLFLISFAFMYRNSVQLHLMITHTVIKRGSLVVFPVLILAFHIYGLGLFCEDTAFMLGFYPNRFYRYIFLICPIAFTYLSVVIVMKFLWCPWWKTWLLMIAYAMPTVIFAPTVLGAILAFFQYLLKLDLGGIVTISSNHGPKSEELKIQREAFRTKRRIF